MWSYGSASMDHSSNIANYLPCIICDSVFLSLFWDGRAPDGRKHMVSLGDQLSLRGLRTKWMPGLHLQNQSENSSLQRIYNVSLFLITCYYTAYCCRVLSSLRVFKQMSMAVNGVIILQLWSYVIMYLNSFRLYWQNLYHHIGVVICRS